MLTWDYDRGVEIDDVRGSNGFNRPEIEDAWIMAHALNEHIDANVKTEEILRRDLAKMTTMRNIAVDHAAAIERVAFDVVSSLGEHARQYAIEQSLCGYFERYLSIAVAEQRDTYRNSETEAESDYHAADRETADVRRSDMLVQRFGRRLTEQLVVSASRPRKFVVSAPVVATVTIPSVHAPSVDPYYNSIETYIEQHNVTWSSRDGDAEVGPGEPYEYEQAQRFNENFHRRGSYAAGVGGDDY